MNITRLVILTLALSCTWSAAPTVENVDDIRGYRNAGDQLALECLSRDRKLVCFTEKGFTCASVGEPSRNGYNCYKSLEGGCYRIRFQLATDGWSSNDQWMTGKCEDTHEPKLHSSDRMMFDNIDAPDFIKFRQLLSSVFSEAIQSDDDRVSWRHIAPGANADTDYDRILSYLLSKYWQIENQIHDEQVSLLCQRGLPRFKDSRLYETFDAFDDLMLKAYAEHLETVRNEFSNDDTFDLDSALNGYEPSFSIYIRKTAGPVDGLYEVAVEFCSTPFSKNLISVE